jgi:diphosphomevalonate decarboxylase
MYFSENDFITTNYYLDKITALFETVQEAPSNIALVKYWGKHAVQLPMNPSVSFTLNKSKTITKAKTELLSEKTQKTQFKFLFEGVHKPDFELKIADFFKRIDKFVPFINHFKWTFDSRNTFPHSSGIASSASGFAALAKIIMAIEKELNPKISDAYLQAKTSFLARLGSGSAARSFVSPTMIWGAHPQLKYTSDLYAIAPDFELHSVFNNYQDTIILVEKAQKKVSSTVGHNLMNSHPYKAIRKQQAFDNTLKILEILKTGEIDKFIDLVEAEALSLHALMMSSKPNYVLMQAETLHIIHEIRNYRQTNGSKVCFTLDAGANVHVLFPENEKETVLAFLQKITNKEMILDFV